MKPLPVRPGDTLAIVAPASLPRDVALLHAGVEQLRTRGYRVELGRTVYAQRGYLSGSDEERLQEINVFLRRPDVRMILAARGGYGAMRLLPGLDYDAARRHPKLVVGYSDVTALHLALYERAGLCGLSGPMVAVEWHDPDPETERLFWELARGDTAGRLVGPRGEELRPIREGSGEGILLGGNLSVIARLLGTPYLPSLEGCILFIEDVAEQPYRIDAILAQLRLSGILDRLAGLVVGAFTECEPAEDSPSLTVEEVLNDYLSSLRIPVASDLVYGHFPVKNTVPIGVRAHLEVTSSRASLTLLEPVVQR